MNSVMRSRLEPPFQPSKAFSFLGTSNLLMTRFLPKHEKGIYPPDPVMSSGLASFEYRTNQLGTTI